MKIRVTPSLTGECKVHEVINHQLGRRVSFIFEGDDIEVADEYHTMHELYQHRMALNMALFHVLENTTDNHDFRVYKSEHHHPDGDPMFEGYFIVFCFDTRNGNWTSYHYKQKHWDEFDIPTASHPPLYPKGHVSAIEFLSGMFKS